jgi:oligopeptide/dipeptide ABC transporter ATP-binding protein
MTDTPQGGDASPLLRCEDIVQEFRVRRRSAFGIATVAAVSGVSISIPRGQAYALVGETGSGKSTFARAVIGAPPPRSGRVFVAGKAVSGRGRKASRERGRMVQMVFQDPMSAMDPQWSVERIVAEPLRAQGVAGGKQRRARVAEALDMVGISPGRFGARRPTELSGGQAQRVAIARALVVRPALVILDEPVTALDVSVQAEILRLLWTLRQELSLTYLLISHDLAVVRSLADQVGTMYLGRLCETGTTEDVFTAAAHPYTAALLSAIPRLNSRADVTASSRIRLRGDPPSALSPPSGCRFRTRCPYAEDVCAEQTPPLAVTAGGHAVACHFPLTAAGRAAGPASAGPLAGALPDEGDGSAVSVRQ